MSATVEAAPDVAQQLEERRERLSALQAEREQVADALSRQREAYGRAVAAGEPPKALQGIRTAIADLTTQLEGLDAAIPIVAAEIPPLETEFRTQEAARLDVEADRLESEVRALKLQTAEELRRHAAEFAALWQTLQRTSVAAREARRAALRAEGADRDVIYHAEPKDRSLTLESLDAERSFAHVVTALLSYAPKAED